MLGACNAGMDSIWYNPKHVASDPDIPVTHTVESFDEILDLLQNDDERA